MSGVKRSSTCTVCRHPNVKRIERAIGVVYRPHTERVSHWFRARLADQFDSVIHLDRTSAVEPLVRKEPRATEDVPETYPFAL